LLVVSIVTAQKNPLFRIVCSFIFVHHHCIVTFACFVKQNYFY
jgi:hypothetical protein